MNGMTQPRVRLHWQASIQQELKPRRLPERELEVTRELVHVLSSREAEGQSNGVGPIGLDRRCEFLGAFQYRFPGLKTYQGLAEEFRITD